MKYILALSAAFALTACGSDDNTQTQQSSEAEQAAGATEEKGVPVVDNVEEMVRDKIEELTSGVTLDTSSLDSFKSSLSDMQASLSTDQAGQLQDALGYLAKSTAKESQGGLLGAAKDVVSGKSMEDILYDNMKGQLDGLSFEEILALAS